MRRGIRLPEVTSGVAITSQVAAAAKKALEEYKRAHPEVDEKDFAVDIPQPAAGPSHPNPHAHVVPPPRPPAPQNRLAQAARILA